MIALEDSFADVIGKSQRGLGLSDDQLAAKSGVAVSDLARVKSGKFSEEIAGKVAPALRLSADALVALGNSAWRPRDPGRIDGLRQFNTPYEDMTVNAYLVWEPASRAAAVFDSGATSEPILAFAKENGLSIQTIFLTHTHRDHVADLPRLKKETGAPAYVGADEQFPGAEAIQPGRTFKIGALDVEARRTSGHARGGITYVVRGLARTLAIVGDALFAGSMGGGLVSFEEALRTNREQLFTLPDETIVCPGHGPLTSIGEEKAHNPFYPEFQQPRA